MSDYFDRIEAHLLDAVERHANSRTARWPALRRPPDHRRSLPSAGAVLSALSLGVAVAIAILVVVVIGSARRASAPAAVPGSARSALDRAARAAAAGTATPRLAPGQSWYTGVIGLYSSQAYCTPSTALARLIIQHELLAKWIPSSGEEHEVTVTLNGALGAQTMFSQGTPSDAAGFGDWDPGSVQNFPTTPGGVLRTLRTEHRGWPYAHNNVELPNDNASAFTQLAQIAAILGDQPLSPAARAAVFRTVAKLPDLRYLGAVRSSARARSPSLSPVCTSNREPSCSPERTSSHAWSRAPATPQSRTPRPPSER
jgi:hypothetical protein